MSGIATRVMKETTVQLVNGEDQMVMTEQGVKMEQTETMVMKDEM